MEGGCAEYSNGLLALVSHPKIGGPDEAAQADEGMVGITCPHSDEVERAQDGEDDLSHSSKAKDQSLSSAGEEDGEDVEDSRIDTANQLIEAAVRQDEESEEREGDEHGKADIGLEDEDLDGGFKREHDGVDDYLGAEEEGHGQRECEAERNRRHRRG